MRLKSQEDENIVKNTGGGLLDSLGSEILFGKRYFGVRQKYSFGQ